MNSENSNPETDDIILQEEVEVNETPGVQLGGYYDLTKDRNLGLFLEKGDKLVKNIIGGGFIMDENYKKVDVYLDITGITKNVTILVPPISYYFKSDGTIPDSYNDYIAALPPTLSYKRLKGVLGSGQVKVSHKSNLIDKLIYDLLYTTQEQIKGNNLENVKAFISITARMYTLLLLSLLLHLDPEDIKITLSRGPTDFFSDKYDLFNALQVLRKDMAFFTYDDNNLSALLTGKLFDKSIKNKIADPTQVFTPPIIKSFWEITIFDAIFSQLGEGFMNLDITNIKEADKNFTYYILEFIYQYITILLYSLFKLNEQKYDVDEIKTYKEFRTTEEFLKAMPKIIDEAFSSMAVQTVSSSPTDPLNPLKSILDDIFTLLKNGATDLTVADTTHADNKVFTTLVGNISKIATNLEDPTKKQVVTDFGLNQDLFIAKKNDFTSTPATATFTTVKSLVTNKKWFDEIKGLAQTLSAEYQKVPAALKKYQDMVANKANTKTKLEAATAKKTNATAAVTAAQAAVTAATAGTPAATTAQETLTKAQADETAASTELIAATTSDTDAQKNLDISEQEKNDIESTIDKLQNETFYLIQELEENRFQQSPFKEYKIYNIVQRIWLYNPPTLNDATNPNTNFIEPIENSRNDILNQNVDYSRVAAVPANPNAATGLLDTYQNSLKPLRDNLISSYENLKRIFLPTSQYKNEEFVKELDGIINTFKTTAPFNVKIVDTEFNAAGDKIAYATGKLEEVKQQFIELKKLLAPPNLSNAGAVIPPGLQNTTPKGPYYNAPNPGMTLIRKPLVDELIQVMGQSGGSKKTKTRRNRKQNNTKTRRNNEITY
jgi:hypothetical protein